MKSTTAFDDQYDCGFYATEIEQILPGAVSIDPEFAAQKNSLTMIAGGTEMLRVAEDGFWVRGVKVEQDDREAEIVYNAFKQFLTWAELNRR